MNATPDRLSLLRAKYVQQIREKEAELQALKQKVSLIDELDAESSEIKAPQNGQRRYASGYTLTVATLDTMKELGGKVTIAQVERFLRENGFAPGGKNFTISVAKTLKRLHGQGKINSERRGGKRMYWKNEAHVQDRIFA